MGANMKIETHLLQGRRVGKFIDVKGLDENATVKEAIEKGYVVGKQELIVSNVKGVMRSMVSSITRDGNGRKIDNVVSIQPSIKCKMADNCEPVTKDNVEAGLRARVLSDGEVDTTGWTFTVEGQTSTLTVYTITTGEELNEVVIGEAIDFNGVDLNLPTTATITWTAVDVNGSNTQTGSIAAADRTCSTMRITTAASVLSSLTGSTWEGGTIVFTITNGTKKAIKSATLRVSQD